MPKTVHIVSHTHWDREWYLSFDRFRVQLASAVDRVLDRLESDRSFEHFLLDGQAVILEDFLALRPGQEARIGTLVRTGKLSIGPWYVLPDEYLIGAESMARNLLLGARVCQRFGGAHRVGYMPDSFGHPAQTPQLLRKAGIDSFIYQRGNGDELDELGAEYRWRAPDGSEVIACHLVEGYCNGGGLGYDEIWHAHTQREVRPKRAVEQVAAWLEKATATANGEQLLLMNGCDHFPPQPKTEAILSELRTAFPEIEFRHTSLAGYLQAVRDAGSASAAFSGELRYGKTSHILSGVWSARVYLKQLHERTETLLAGVLEPLLAYTHMCHGRDYPEAAVDDAWKRLLQNAPHDSICGCSIDSVHREMVTRYDGTLELIGELLEAEMRHLVPTFARDADGDRHTTLAVMNPSPHARTEVIERLVVLQPCCAPTESLRLFDDVGREVPFEIVESWFVERFWGVDYRMMPSVDDQLAKFRDYRDAFGPRILRDSVESELTDRYLRIRFQAHDLPAVGHRTYRLTDAVAGTAELEGSQPVGEPVSVAVGEATATLANGVVRVDVMRDGRLDVTELATGRSYQGLNRYQSTEDVGDEYDYSPAAESQTLTSEGLHGELGVVAGGGHRGAVEVRFDWQLPGRISSDRRRRVTELTTCAVAVVITLDRGSPLVKLQTTVDNQVEDHRLRALSTLR